MYITFNSIEITNGIKKEIIKKINLNQLESIDFGKDSIRLYPPTRFKEDTSYYIIKKSENENYEEIKEKLMKL